MELVKQRNNIADKIIEYKRKEEKKTRMLYKMVYSFVKFKGKNYLLIIFFRDTNIVNISNCCSRTTSLIERCDVIIKELKIELSPLPLRPFLPYHRPRTLQIRNNVWSLIRVYGRITLSIYYNV